MSEQLAHLQDWVGKVREQEDQVTAAPLAGLSAALDRDDPPPSPGDPLPPCWHWMFFHDNTPQSELGPDGHTARGVFMPPVPLPRRMWAGSRLNFHAPPRLGETMTKRSEILSVTPKAGKTGQLVFVVVRHTVGVDGRVAIEEEQDIVYRSAPAPGEQPRPPKPAPSDARWSREIAPDPVLLFRYSALTFNAHRIHYDHPFCLEQEGYPGLVVHGPLLATLLVDLCRRERPDAPIRAFNFRALSPLFDTAPFTVNGVPSEDGARADIWAADAKGCLATQGEVTFA